MQTRLISKEAVKAKFEVTIPAVDVDKTYSSVFSTLARQVKIPGFRPGKAPKGVIMKRIGDEALAQEVKEALIDRSYAKAVKELELQPLHAHLINDDSPVEGQDYSFEIEVDLYPEFSLPDLEEIIIDTAPQPMTDAMVEDAVKQLQSENATHVPVDRAVEADDYIMIETLREGEDAGTAMPIDLERVGEHLANQLIGKTIGDEVDLDLAPAEDDDDTETEESIEAAAEVATEEQTIAEEPEKPEKPELPKLKVRITDVKFKEKPELNDEFAKTLGMETWSEVEQAVKKNIQSQLDNEAFEAQREEFIDKLVEETSVELPAFLVNRRKASLLQNLAEDLKKQNNLSLDAYLAQLDEQGKREEFEGELEDSAKTGVKRDLVLERLLEERGTTMDNSEFENALAYLSYRQGMQVAKFKTQMGQSWIENYRFLLTRDKAIREIVREKLGLDNTDDAEEIAEEIAEEVAVEEATKESEA